MMTCTRCGEAEIAHEEIFVVGFDQDLDLKAAIDAELRKNRIDGLTGLAGLCPRCYGIAEAAIEEGARLYYATRRDFIQQQSEANLGRPLTATEREQIDAYFDGPDKPTQP
jgi:hypothetical protein